MGKSRVQVSDVLVQTYTEEGALKVVLQTLRDADFKQIAKQLEKDTRHLTKTKKQRKSKGGGASGAAASGHDLESEDCVDRGPHTNSEDPEKQLLVTEAQVGASNWKEFTPEVSASSGHILYRFRCPHSFYSSPTGLMLVVDGGAGLQYRTVQRDENLLESAGSEAAGPMLNIKCPEDAVSQLHSPHCETAPVPNLPSVVNITDDGMNVTEPLKITESHVFMNASRLSLYGLWKKISQGFRSVTIRILMVLSPPNSRTKTQNLYLFLLPSNVPLEEVAAKCQSDQYIEVPVNCILVKGESYSVRCPEAILIQPERQEFYTDFGPNYHPMFEVHLQTNTELVTLTLQDEENRKVWEQTVDLPGSGPTQSPEQKVELIRVEFINRVSDSSLRYLLDILLHKGVITPNEMESTRTLSRANKARQVFDTVWIKGPAASSVLIAALCEVDPCLSRQLNLM